MKFELHYLEKYIILSVVICVFICSGGYSFAYFTSHGNGGVSGEGASLTTTTTKLPKVTFDGGSNKIDTTLSGSTFYPGTSVSKAFSVETDFTGVEGIETSKYYIHISIKNNTFKCGSKEGQCNEENAELKYTLLKTKHSETNYVTVKSGNIIGDDKIGPIEQEANSKDSVTLPNSSEDSGTRTGVLYDYILKIEYKETNTDQNYNEDASFTATIDVDFNAK